ncbi:polysaccharide deacetylase family protein [Xanthomarina sp.]|uniref:polysaccharide deacetylase family protein n=1 Tax=Xanthomarina sp. TaxID=1931211 RepID=UPI002CFE9993|nr:polysaccharide deacetylase family protein [Xanthomarina sp.]HLV38967.1 polysaccharide deacetylase family protein [Xanthomarina sp.]
MEFIPAKLPLLIIRLFPKYIWNMPTEEQVIYLTFDDGPTPEITPWTLDVLDQYQAKATFFCIGNNVEKHPDIFLRTVENGHAIGNHSYSHPKGWRSSAKAYLKNVKRAQDIIDFQLKQPTLNEKAALSKSTTKNQQSKINKLFRPPYGQITKKQGQELMALGYKIIMWSVLAIDWSEKTSKEKALKNVIKNAKNGSIVVFHDSVKASENMQYALPRVLEYFSKKGYRFKALDAGLITN